MNWQLVIGLISAVVIDSRMSQHLSQAAIQLRHAFVNFGHANRRSLFVDVGRVRVLLFAKVDVEAVLRFGDMSNIHKMGRTGSERPGLCQVLPNTV